MWGGDSADPEALEPCPYENAHMVRRKRMQYHLMKCRKNHPGKDFATCPFNACHEMPRPELRYHIANCPDKHIIEKDLAYAQEMESEEGGLFKGCTDVPAYNSYEVSCSEDWDEDVNPHPRIGVDERFMEKVKFKNITGMTPSEKRYFHRTLNPEHIPPELTEPSLPKPVVNNKENRQPNKRVDGKLRLPKNAPKAFSMYAAEPASAPFPAGPLNQQAPPTVFAYSLAQCGIGRGRGVAAGLGRGMSVPKPASSVGAAAGVSRTQTPAATLAHDAQFADYIYEDIPAAPQTTQSPVPPKVSVPPGIFPTHVQKKPAGRGRGAQSVAADQWPSLNGGGQVFSDLLGSGSVQNGNPTFVVPKVADLKSLSRDWFESDSSGSSAEAQCDVHGIEDAKKRKRLQKKLRQIDALEEKQRSGVNLTTEEEIKVAKKDDICEELESLTI